MRGSPRRGEPTQRPGISYITIASFFLFSEQFTQGGASLQDSKNIDPDFDIDPDADLFSEQYLC